MSEIDENGDTKGSMWDLREKLDQPMDEEAGRLKNITQKFLVNVKNTNDECQIVERRIYKPELPKAGENYLYHLGPQDEGLRAGTRSLECCGTWS
ncbi:hypothetical protein AgCh_023130 [Apium graveolens]